MYRRVKRKSLILPRSLSQGSEGRLSQNNDAEERRANSAKRRRLSTSSGGSARRRSSGGGMRRRRSSAGPARRRLSVAIGWTDSQTELEPKPQKSSEDLTNLYLQTVQLSIRGRITSKQAWDLESIRYTKEMLKAERPDFQKAGTVIDVNSKIYAARVDDLLQRGEKVRNGMLLAKEMPDEEEEALRRKKLRIANKKTLLEPEALKANLEALTDTEDPMFRKMSEMFDAGDTKGLLLNNLMSQDAGVLVFCAGEKLSCTQEPQEKELDATNAEEIFKRLNIPKPRKSTAKSIKTMKSMLREYEFETGNGMPPPPLPQEISDVAESEDLVVNGDFSDMLKDEGSGAAEPMDDFNDFGGDGGMDNFEPEFQLPDDHLAQGLDATMVTFFEAPKVNEHYKKHAWHSSRQWSKAHRIEIMRNRSKGGAAQPGSAEKKKRKKRRVNYFEFSETPSKIDDRAWKEQHPERYKIKAKDRQAAAQNNHLLPKDLKLSEEVFFKPFLMPNVRYSYKHSTGLVQEDRDPFAEDDVMDEYPDYGFEQPMDEDLPPEPPAELSDDVLKPPEEEEKEELKVPYTMSALCVNIRALKNLVYQSFKQCLKKSDTDEVTFQEVVDKLKKDIKPEMLNGVTPHLLFITLLYLCNEKQLQLTPCQENTHENVGMFTIRET